MLHTYVLGGGGSDCIAILCVMGIDWVKHWGARARSIQFIPVYMCYMHIHVLNEPRAQRAQALEALRTCPHSTAEA